MLIQQICLILFLQLSGFEKNYNKIKDDVSAC